MQTRELSSTKMHMRNEGDVLGVYVDIEMKIVLRKNCIMFDLKSEVKIRNM